MIKTKLIQLTALLFMLTSASANAALLITMTNDGSGGVNVTGSGSGVVTGTQSINDWDYFNFLTNFIVLGGGETNLVHSTSASGILANVSTGISSVIDRIQVDSDISTGDDFEFETTDIISFTSGDDFSFSLEANFNASTFLFSNLVEGTHIQPGGIGSEDIFGPLTLIIDDTNVNFVSTPSVLVMFALGFLIAGFRRI